MLGEHGDSEFAAWSMTHIAGIPVDTYCTGRADWPAERARIEQAVRESAYHIIGYKGATYFAVALALVRITAAVLRGQKSVFTVSAALQGEFGLREVCLSAPCIVSARGVEKVIESPLPGAEFAALRASAETLRRAAADAAVTG
jgi:L-lactate dehydrogenase